MPIINSTEGKLKSILLLDDVADQSSIGVVKELAHIVGETCHIHYIIAPLDPNTVNRPSLETLPANVIKHLPVNKNLNRIDFNMVMMRAHKHVTDFTVPCKEPANGNSVIFFDLLLEGLRQNYPSLFQSFDIRSLKTICPDEFNPFHLEGGDIITASDFMIIGPQCYSKRMERMDQADYWPIFSQDFFYKNLNENQILKLEPIEDFRAVWDEKNTLYHLDLYLTYGGVLKDGKRLFFLGKITEETLLQNRQHRVALNKINKYLTKVEEQLRSFFKGNVKIETLPLIPEIPSNSTSNTLEVYSYNNALVEVDANSRKFIMPVYNIDFSEQETAETTIKKYFGGKGEFATVNIPEDYVKVQKQSLHCIASVLERW